MTFEKQVEKAKEEKLKNRIIRDIIFITLGIVFFMISILMAYNNSKKETNTKDNRKFNNANKKSTIKN